MQPALLYLVPACLGASLVVGLLRGEFWTLLAYEEEGAAGGEDKEKKKN